MRRSGAAAKRRFNGKMARKRHNQDQNRLQNNTDTILYTISTQLTFEITNQTNTCHF